MAAENSHIDVATIQAITPVQAWHYRIVPSKVDGSSMEFLIEKGGIKAGLENELMILFGKKISLQEVEGKVISDALYKFYRRDQKVKLKKTLEADDFLEVLLQESKSLKSSDIHLEVYENKGRARMRIDGKLIEKFAISLDDYNSLINKIKIKANLDIAEKRLPQDGRIVFGQGKEAIDIRVSVLPTMYGEKAVLRLLSKEASHLNMDKLGMAPHQIEIYQRAAAKSHGIILISGPTGSGKTTTLYATLNYLNSIEKNILTIEDPIEYTLEGINQVQLREKIGLDFGRALRTFLRQDPDIIMLGEIRDPDTAQMATRAALTGHLVLSTIHTNSALGILSRLSDMGVPEFLVASTLNLAVAQRLVRILCPHCKKEEALKAEMLPFEYRQRKLPATHFTEQGCENCYFTGYQGRVAIYEMIENDDQVSEKIRNKELNLDYIKQEGKTRFLADSAMKLFEKGETSLKEIYPNLITNHL